MSKKGPFMNILFNYVYIILFIMARYTILVGIIALGVYIGIKLTKG